MLTRKQYELLVIIEKGLRETGISPSYDEMKDALALRSKSGIHRLITGLEERGFIRRLPHRARALEVLRLPENMDAPAPAGGFSPNVIKGEFKLPGTRASADTKMVELPLYGRIAAGTPTTAGPQNPTIGPGAEMPISVTHCGGSAMNPTKSVIRIRLDPVPISVA